LALADFFFVLKDFSFEIDKSLSHQEQKENQKKTKKKKTIPHLAFLNKTDKFWKLL
jgi:hypothetical protein